MIPEIDYALVGEQNVAFQVFGDGPIDVVLLPPIVSHVELQWELPRFAHFLERLGSFARVATFDKRGTGLSDPVLGPGVLTLEERMDDTLAVMDAVGFDRAVVIGYAEGGSLAMLLAATHPGRVAALVLCNAAARLLRADDYPWGWDPGSNPMSDFGAVWGREVGDMLKRFGPESSAEPDWDEYVRFNSRFDRAAASPGIFNALQGVAREIDVRHVLHTISCPTLVLHRVENQIVDVGCGRYLASHIPGAKYVELPGGDHYPYLVGAEEILGEMQEFLTGERPAPEVDRILCTVLFTDIVGSTERAAQMGDGLWKELLGRHNAIVRRELERFRGREVGTAGDGFVAIFDGPARAVRCANAIGSGVRSLDIRIRAGVHTGECEVVPDGIAGIAVHVAARIAGLADADEVLASSTVKDLVAGSGIAFQDRGMHSLKGVPDEWRIFAVVE